MTSPSSDRAPTPEGLLVVLSAPSGTGKSTIARRLLERNPRIVFSVSWTSRDPRAGEVDGREYRFVDEKTFRKMIDDGKFLEWAEVHGHLYGTGAEETHRVIESGRDLLLDIDVQGAEQVRTRQQKAVSVFVLPPDWRTLRERLTGRGTDRPEVRALRLAAARREAARSTSYDYIVINRDLEVCVSEIESILLAERRRGHRMTGVAGRFLEEADSAEPGDAGGPGGSGFEGGAP